MDTSFGDDNASISESKSEEEPKIKDGKLEETPNIRDKPEPSKSLSM